MTSEHAWKWVESVEGYEVWRRQTTGTHIYQVTKYGEGPPTIYAGYANKNALLRMKGLI
ncbi:MAG: hypothetical protein GY799_29435 [Desulfobulbaceae bacterium]|nr:hypothetical protein [Desulfobulbaceae bacterium]